MYSQDYIFYFYTAIIDLIPLYGYVVYHASIIEEVRQITHVAEIYGYQAIL